MDGPDSGELAGDAALTAPDIDAGLADSGADGEGGSAARDAAAAPEAGEPDAASPDFGVSLVTPTDDLIVGATPVTIELAVTGDVERVELLLDSAVLATVEPPYILDWDPAATPEGHYALGARAWLGDASARSDTVEVWVDHTGPVLVAASPDDGAVDVGATDGVELTFDEPVRAPVGALDARSGLTGAPLAVEHPEASTGGELTLRFEPALEVPESVELSITDQVVDVAGNAATPATITFEAPVWQRLGGTLNRDPDAVASELHLAHDDAQRLVALWAEDGGLFAARLEANGWAPLGGSIDGHGSLPSPATGRRSALAIDADGAPVVAWRSASEVEVVRWSGTAWEATLPDADVIGGGLDAPALTVDGAGVVLVAFDELDAGPTRRLRVRRLGSSAWLDAGDPIEATVGGPRLRTGRDGAPLLAYRELAPTPAFRVARWDGGQFAPLGTGTALAASGGDFDLTAGGGDDAVITARGAGTARLVQGAWQPLAQELGFLVSAAADDRALATDPQLRPVAAFAETPPDAPASRVFVQRFQDGYWQPLGPALNRDRDAAAGHPALAVGVDGELDAGWLETQANGAVHVHVSRFNSPGAGAPRGVRQRQANSTCLATAPADGSDLVDNGCMADAGGRVPVPGFIPYDVRSPLWTDGASKRRFVLLPDTTASIEYRDPGLFSLPPGSIIYKEFSIEARRGDPTSLRPVETRFLVVHDDGVWDRYSYEWNQDATQAVLRPATPAQDRKGFDVIDEGGAPLLAVHFYPARGDCLQCHQTPGVALGFQTVQLNRNLDYGGTVDNQLRALASVGVLDSGFDGAIGDAGWMPNAADAFYPTEARLRAYLHANCSSCHHPLFGLDLRHEVPTVDASGDSGLCGKIVKGDLDGSRIYWRDVLRQAPERPGAGAPMPPLGTLVENPLIEELLTDWILDPQNPCP